MSDFGARQRAVYRVWGPHPDHKKTSNIVDARRTRAANVVRGHANLLCIVQKGCNKGAAHAVATTQAVAYNNAAQSARVGQTFRDRVWTRV